MLEVGHVHTALAIMAAGTDKLHNGSAMKVFLPMGKHGLITIALSLLCSGTTAATPPGPVYGHGSHATGDTEGCCVP